jgi:hypothetical protein
VLHTLGSVFKWVVIMGFALAILGMLIWLLRIIWKDSVGKPWLRALMLFAFAFGLFVLWAVGQVAP